MLSLIPPALPCPALPLQAKLGAVGDLGFRQAMQNKWVALDKSGGGEARVVTKVAAVEDRVHVVLAAISQGQVRAAADCGGLAGWH